MAQSTGQRAHIERTPSSVVARASQPADLSRTRSLLLPVSCPAGHWRTTAHSPGRPCSASTIARGVRECDGSGGPCGRQSREVCVSLMGMDDTLVTWVTQ